MAGEYQVLNCQAVETVTAITNGTAKTITEALLEIRGMKAVEAVVYVEDEAIRFWQNGTAPTTTVGMKAAANTSFTLKGYHDIKNFQCISVSGTDAKISVQIFFPF